MAEIALGITPATGDQPRKADDKVSIKAEAAAARANLIAAPYLEKLMRSVT